MRFFIGILLSVFIGLLSVFSSQKVICNTMSLKNTGVVVEAASNKSVQNSTTTNKAHKLISLKHNDSGFQATEHIGSLSQSSFRANSHSIQRLKKTIAKMLMRTEEQHTSVSRNKIHDSFYKGRTERAAIYVYIIRQLLI